jgi:hypothetical protein
MPTHLAFLRRIALAYGLIRNTIRWALVRRADLHASVREAGDGYPIVLAKSPHQVRCILQSGWDVTVLNRMQIESAHKTW